MTARVVDENGFINIDNNPITREGVFGYLGQTIDPTGDLGLEPGRIYQVYRPASEISDPVAINSFKLVPFFDDHAMAGPSDEGYLPAEKKGIHGTTGENVDFRNGVLYSNIKIFSETLAKLINAGKKELSLGYRCIFEKSVGTFAGKAYDFIQRSLRGNHLALVDRGRNDVAILDRHVLATDHFDLNINPEDKVTMDEELKKRLDAMDAAISSIRTAMDAKAKDEDDDTETEEEKEKRLAKEKRERDAEDDKDEDGEEKKPKKSETEDEDDEDDDKKKKKSDAQDAAIDDLRTQVSSLKKDGVKTMMREINARNDLAKRVAEHVGAFDHAEMTTEEVAKYGVEKLNLKAPKGQEQAALEGFLHGRTAPSAMQSTAMDSRETKAASASLDAFIAGK